jgi:glycerophosphoryl diester phosphodiesterase
MCRHCAYNTNAYLVRASVSMDPDSDICGASMIVTPRGEVLTNMYSKTGLGVAEFDPHDKYLKPAGFANPPAPHYEYIEFGRNPWQYRPGGSAIIRHDGLMPYPRTCSHRGFNTIAPENSMPAFGAAVAMGAEEIEFDLWATKDGEIVTAHDPNLERVSNGHGNIWEYTLTELKALDFGVKFGEKYKNIRIPTFEEILKKFAGRVIMNIHVKIWDIRQKNLYLEKIAALIRKYDCERHVYFMSVNTDALLEMRKILPYSGYCHGAERSNEEMIDLAIKHGFDKVQLVGWYPYNKAMVDKCHAHGIKVNFCQADTPEDARRVLDMGVDCVLANDFHYVKSGLEK